MKFVEIFASRYWQIYCILLFFRERWWGRSIQLFHSQLNFIFNGVFISGDISVVFEIIDV